MNAPDKALLARQYNNRELVPDHAQYFARWAEGSARARSTMACHLDIPYGDRPGEAIDLSTYYRWTRGRQAEPH